jgi:outer membrane lipoprotein-sorting protein
MKLQTSSFKLRRSDGAHLASLATSQPPKRICWKLEPGNFFGFWILKFEVLLSCLVLFGSLPCRAADPDAVLDAWFGAQTNLHTWTADLVQTRTLKTLTRPLVVNGHIAFAAPSDFRWELGRPARTMAVRSGDDMFVVYPLLKRAERYSLGASTPQQLRDTMSLLQAGFPHDRREFAAQFKVLSLTETNGDWQFALQPKSAFARQMMPQLNLRLATNDFSLASTELVFVDGSTMRSDFTNAVVNPPLDASLFQWTPPADFKVTSPFGK